jgi:hypothetical protein
MTSAQAQALLAQAVEALRQARELGHDVPAALVETSFTCARCAAGYTLLASDAGTSVLTSGALNERCRGSLRRAELRWKLPGS